MYDQSKEQTSNEHPSDIKTWRIIVGLLSIPFIFLTFILLKAIIVNLSLNRLTLIFTLFWGSLSFLCLWFAIKGNTPNSRIKIKFSSLSGLILGTVGFLGGFIGPIIFTPGANQGPLLGILITGPLGFSFGIIGGALFKTVRKPQIKMMN